MDRTKVYVFTDASDKDKDKLPDVLALIEEKKVQVKFLLTGTCASDRRRKRGRIMGCHYKMLSTVRCVRIDEPCFA